MPYRKIGTWNVSCKCHATRLEREQYIYIYIYGHAGMQKRVQNCAEEWVTYRTGSSAVVIFLSLLFQFVIVVMLIVLYVLLSVFTWVISHRELPAFP